MIKSMTGYGKGEAACEGGQFTVEIRGVNHRYGEISVRMPRGFMAQENEVKKIAAAVLKRGKIDIFVQWDEQTAVAQVPQPDLPVARAYGELFRSLGSELGLEADIPLSLILSQKGVLKEAVALVEDDRSPQMLDAVQRAVTAMDAMRVREGEALLADLAERRRQIGAWVGQIRHRAPQVVEEYRQKLQARLNQLLEGAEVDPWRLAQEVALMADRCDVTEELVRLESHFVQFDETLLLAEPVGRKLDFMMQEMNREVNTIGSKSSDAEMTSLVIRIKAEMEKMREQVQNIE